MSILLEILRPGFLLRDALVGSVLVGIVCPLVGVYFVLRRMIFLGVALPQLSAAGIAFAFLVHRTVVGPHVHLEVGERVLARLGGAAGGSSRPGLGPRTRPRAPSRFSSSPRTPGERRRW